jgi:hypothetical protein
LAEPAHPALHAEEPDDIHLVCSLMQRASHLEIHQDLVADGNESQQGVPWCRERRVDSQCRGPQTNDETPFEQCGEDARGRRLFVDIDCEHHAPAANLDDCGVGFQLLQGFEEHFPLPAARSMRPSSRMTAITSLTTAAPSGSFWCDCMYLKSVASR